VARAVDLKNAVLARQHTADGGSVTRCAFRGAARVPFKVQAADIQMQLVTLEIEIHGEIETKLNWELEGEVDVGRREH
jgi:hypothetical protein